VSGLWRTGGEGFGEGVGLDEVGYLAVGAAKFG